MGFPGGSSVKETTCHCRRCKRPGFNSWVGKIPGKRGQQPTAVFLPGESHRQRSVESQEVTGVGNIACTHREYSQYFIITLSGMQSLKTLNHFITHLKLIKYHKSTILQ